MTMIKYLDDLKRNIVHDSYDLYVYYYVLLWPDSPWLMSPFVF